MERIILRGEQFVILVPIALLSLPAGLLILVMQFRVPDWGAWLGYYTVPFAVSVSAVAATFMALDDYLHHGLPAPASDRWQILCLIIFLGVAVAVGPIVATVTGYLMPWMDEKGSALFALGVPAAIPAVHAIYLLAKANRAAAAVAEKL